MRPFNFSTPAKIIDGLYYGNSAMASDIDMLKSIGITHIINCDGNPNKLKKFEKHIQIFKYKAIDIEDGNCDIKKYFLEVFDFINTAIKEEGNVFIHCKYGISRSGSFVVAYIMNNYGFNYDQAWDFVRQKRKVCCPNEFFRKQINDFFDAKI